MKFRICLFVLLLAVAGTAGARDREALKHIEASMVVTGHVDIAADGAVTGHSIDQRDELPDFVVDLIDRQAPGWLFEPYFIDGKPVAARSRMSLRVVAQPVGDGDDYEVRIANGTFHGNRDPDADDAGRGTDEIRRASMKPPRYPDSMLSRGIRGVVYLLVKIDRDGRVDDLAVERVNLRSYGSERDMRDMRNAFANSTVRAARRWRFEPPTTGEQADDEFWTIRVPVSYELGDSPGFHEAGHWTLYIPGPRGSLPDWVPDRTRNSDSDAMLAGELQMLGTERQLLTPLDG